MTIVRQAAQALTTGVRLLVEQAPDVITDPDPWYTMSTLAIQICSLQCADRGFTEAFFLRHPNFTDDRLKLVQAQLATLVEQCKTSGRVRTDVTADDIVLLLIPNAALAANAPKPQPASARFAAHYLRAIEAYGSYPLPPLPELGLRSYLHLQDHETGR